MVTRRLTSTRRVSIKEEKESKAVQMEYAKRHFPLIQDTPTK